MRESYTRPSQAVSGGNDGKALVNVRQCDVRMWIEMKRDPCMVVEIHGQGAHKAVFALVRYLAVLKVSKTHQQKWPGTLGEME